MKLEGQQSGLGASVSARLGVGAWAILVVLLLLLAGTFAAIYLGWRLASGTDVPASGYVAMAFGVIVSLGVGFGLMALIFYSSRKGYDEPPVLISPGGSLDEILLCLRQREMNGCRPQDNSPMRIIRR